MDKKRYSLIYLLTDEGDKMLSDRGTKHTEFEAYDNELWQHVATILLGLSRKQQEKKRGVVMLLLLEKGVRVVCDNNGESQGFNVLLREIARLQKELRGKKLKNRK